MTVLPAFFFVYLVRTERPDLLHLALLLLLLLFLLALPFFLLPVAEIPSSAATIATSNTTTTTIIAISFSFSCSLTLIACRWFRFSSSPLRPRCRRPQVAGRSLHPYVDDGISSRQHIFTLVLLL